MKILTLALSTITALYFSSAFCAVGDGVIFDENGLTIIMGQEPIVDNSRWNSSEGTYTLTNGAPGYVKAIKNAQGKVVAVKKTFTNINELHANALFSDNSATITLDFCNKFESQKIELEGKKCQNYLMNFFTLYESQGNKATLKTLQDVATLDGVPPIASLEALQTSIKDQVSNFKSIESRTIIANVGYLAMRCNALKRYSIEEATTPVSSAANKAENSPK